MKEHFSVHQMSTKPRKQPGKPNETTGKSRDIWTFLNKERNVVARGFTEKKSLR